MTFTSLGFLLFFPAVCLVWFCLPARVKPAWLLAASYWFYACADWRGPFLLAFTTVWSYAAARALASPKTRSRRAVLAAAAAVLAGLLALFKYLGFALQSAAALLGLAGVAFTPPAFSLILPLGISFYTFQTIGYLADVYRGTLAPEKNFVRYALFVSFFPQVVSGPIARGGDLLPQLAQPAPFAPDRVRDGLCLMLWGYFQKLVIADQAALAVNTVFGDYAVYGGVERLLAAVLYALQIYADFAGYTAIARGAAQVLGFHLAENFRQPYLAQSVREFWGRWHITLSHWLRDYIYIPLGGSRRGALRRYLNLFATFLLSGLWHGAAWHYVAWGALHAVYQIAGDATAGLRRRCNLRAGVPGAVGAAGVHLCAGDGGLGVFPRRFGAAGGVVSGRHRGLVRPLGADRRHAADAGPGRLGLVCAVLRRGAAAGGRLPARAGRAPARGAGTPAACLPVARLLCGAGGGACVRGLGAGV